MNDYEGALMEELVTRLRNLVTRGRSVYPTNGSEDGKAALDTALALLDGFYVGLKLR